jgi:prepilin-type N-terminal cleavage/methylation domain-containing protein
MKKTNSRGFTLIELLTVIAVISILAALTLTVGPRMIERAKMTKLDSAFRSVEKALLAYSIDYQTYPPAYGYVGFELEKDLDGPANQGEEVGYYNLMSYMTRMRYHGVEDMHDLFSMSYDTDNNSQINSLEFLPVGLKKPDGTYQLDNTLPRYTDLLPAPALVPFMTELGYQQNPEKRPFIYIPVNKAQFSKVQKYWIDNNDEYATTWDAADPVLSRLTFPPKKYDAFVLISVGPSANTFGLVDHSDINWPVLSANNYRDYYHILCLRSYFLATRDWDANGELDFDFIARTRRGEGAQLPPTTSLRGGAGPVIFVGQSS